MSKVDSLLKTSNELSDDFHENKTSVSAVNLEYLMKIIDYCNDKVTVYLVRSPQHKNSPYFKNEIEFQSIRKTKFPTLEFLDFSNFPISNKEFADYGHLNIKGAKIFSIWFNSLLESGLIEKDNKQQHINQNIDGLRQANSYK